MGMSLIMDKREESDEMKMNNYCILYPLWVSCNIVTTNKRTTTEEADERGVMGRRMEEWVQWQIRSGWGVGREWSAVVVLRNKEKSELCKLGTKEVVKCKLEALLLRVRTLANNWRMIEEEQTGMLINDTTNDDSCNNLINRLYNRRNGN